MDSLGYLFNPSSIAIVGVSSDSTKLGSVLFSNLKESKYPGRIYPVNPKYKFLYEHKCYPNLKAIGRRVDLVCIAVPAEFVPDVMKDAARTKAKAVIIISAGFAEASKEGKALEEEVIAIARTAKIRILGPNCLGFISPGNHINASFAASTPPAGNIAFISQSGAMLTAILDMALERNLGFSHLISLGNKSDINENELIEYLSNDKNIKVIGAYLEEIHDGQELIKIAEKTNKPIVILKAGTSEEGQRAIISHTGSIAGSSLIIKTAIIQTGMIPTHEINEMFNTLMAFSWSHALGGNKIAVITNAGGPGIIITDLISQTNLEMAQLSLETQRELEKALPHAASTVNPIDVIGDALAQRYSVPLQTLISDPKIDAIITLLTPQLVTQIEDTAKIIINNYKLSTKPIIPVFIGGKYVAAGLQLLSDHRIPAFKYVEDAVDVLSKMYEYRLGHKLNSINQRERSKILAKKNNKYAKDVNKFTKAEPQPLPEDLVTKIALELGFDTPEQTVTSDLDKALEFAKNHYPVVIKATTQSIVHKTDQKAIYLNIKNQGEFINAFNELSVTVKNAPLLIQEQIIAEEEVIIGAQRDGDSNVYKESPGFGHLLIFGKGGIYTEIYNDMSALLVPATKLDVFKSFSQTKISAILKGARGQKPLAYNKVLDTILKVQQLVLTYPQIVSLDLNPLLVTRSRAVAVDLKIFVQK